MGDIDDSSVEQVIELRKQSKHAEAFKEIYRLLGERYDRYFGADVFKALEESSLNELRLLSELTIVGFYVHEEIRADVSVLIDRFTILKTSHIVEACRQYNNDRYWYLKGNDNFKLVVKSKRQILIDLPLIDDCLSNERWKPLNPSILPLKDSLSDIKYLCLLRTVNWVKIANEDYKSLETALPEWKRSFTTRNWLLRLDSQLNVLEANEVIDATGHDWSTVSIRGFEDMNIFSFDGSLHFVSTLVRNNNGAHLAGMVAGKIESNEKGGYCVNDFHHMCMNTTECEKNWLPFTDGEGNFNLLYSHDPLFIKRVDLSKKENTYVHVYHDESVYNTPNFLSVNLKKCRGGGGPIEFTYRGKRGYLLCPHETFDRMPKWKVYVHRFVFYNEDWVVEAVSTCFFLDYNDIEFVRSMCWKVDSDSSSILLSVGLLDKEAWIYAVDVERVCNMLSFHCTP